MWILRTTALGVPAFGLALIGTLLAPTGAQASAYTGLLNQFNEIVFGNASGGSKTEGRAVIGGNLTQSSSGSYCSKTSDHSGPCGTSPLPATTPQITGITVGAATQNFGALAVYGNTSGSTISAGKGNVFIDGTNTARLSLSSSTQTDYVATQGTSSKVSGSGNLVYTTAATGVVPGAQNGTSKQGSFVLPDFTTTFEDPLLFLSTYLDGLTGIAQGTSHNFSAAPTIIGGVAVTVYDVLGSNLSQAIKDFNFKLNGAQTVVINVDGQIGALHNSLDTFTGQDNVIWNFYNQTSLTLPDWSGAILAPEAALTLRGASRGDVVAASLIQGGNEILNYAFAGDLNFVPDALRPVLNPVPGNSTAVDAPGGLAALVIGAAGLALARRRSEKAASKL